MKKSPDLISFISALCIHLIIGGVLLMSVDFDLPKEKPKETVAIIEASVVNQKIFDDLAQLKKDKIKEQQRLKEEARKKKAREAAEKKRQADLLKKQAEDKIKAEKAEILRKKLEVERIAAEKAKKEAAEALKKKQAAEKKALAEKKKLEKIKAEKQAAKEKAARDKAAKEKAAKEKAAKEKAAKEKAAKEKAAKEKAARIKAEQEIKRKAEEAKRKAEEEAKRKAEEAERIRQAELDRQMEAEFSDDFSSARNAKQLSEIAKYEALIRGKIGRNWTVDPTMKGSTCTLAIRLAPDGLVISANMSSGDRRLCDSARRAALKARTLPIPKDPEIAPQFRDFDITLAPDL